MIAEDVHVVCRGGTAPRIERRKDGRRVVIVPSVSKEGIKAREHILSRDDFGARRIVKLLLPSVDAHIAK